MTVFSDHPGLLEAFRSGERGALETVYRRYVSDVLRALRAGFASERARIPGIADSALLLDTAQEAFVRAFGPSGRQGYDGVQPYRPYLMRIARNVRIDQLRKQRREISLHGPDGGEEPDESSEAWLPASFVTTPDPQKAALEAEVRRYVSTLPEDEQRFVALRFCEELPQLDVASQLGLTRRRVRTLETSVLTGLRRFLEARTRR